MRALTAGAAVLLRPEQFKTLLTRIGRRCTVVVTGDPDQARRTALIARSFFSETQWEVSVRV